MAVPLRQSGSSGSVATGSAASVGQLRCNKKFRISKKLGSGSFGDIYLGTHVTSNDEVAVKMEPVRTQHPQLLYEAKVLRHLRGGVGIPEILWVGTESDSNIMVLDLLGPSLEDLFNYCSRRFSLKTVLMVGEQMLTRVEYVHTKCFLHRDIKPDNFLMGVNRKSHQVYLIDFGLSKRFMDPKSGQHIPYRTGKSLTGTARYASVNTHLGLEQGRRDDIEGLVYVLLYFLRGSLPWQGLQAANQKEKYHKICLKKQNIPVRELCKGLPAEFGTLLSYTRNLKFDEAPNYNYCRKLLREVFEQNGYTLDYVYDWTMRQNEGSSGRASTVQETESNAANASNRPNRDASSDAVQDGATAGTGTNKQSDTANESSRQARAKRESSFEASVEGEGGGAKGKGKQLVPSSDGKGDSMQCKTQ